MKYLWNLAFEAKFIEIISIKKYNEHTTILPSFYSVSLSLYLFFPLTFKMYTNAHPFENAVLALSIEKSKWLIEYSTMCACVAMSEQLFFIIYVVFIEQHRLKSK